MKNLKRVMFFVSILLVGLTAWLLHYKILLNSDTLFLDALAKDLFSNHGHWSDWRLTPAPAYFPDMLLYFVAYGFVPEVIGRIFFVSAAQVFLLALVCVWLARQIRPKISLNAITTIVLLVCFTTFVAAKSSMWLYFYSTNNHFSALLGALISLGLCIKFIERPSWSRAVLIVLIGGVAQTSSLVFLTCFIAPGLFYNAIVILILSRAEREYRKYRRVFLFMTLCLVGATLLGFALDKLFIFNAPLDGRIPASIPAAAQSFLLFLQATTEAFSKDNVSVLLLSVLVVASFLMLVYKFFYSLHLRSFGFSVLFKQKGTGQINWCFIFAASFLIILLPVNLLMVIASGGFFDLFGYRYLTYPLFLIVILALIMLDDSEARVDKCWTAANLVFAMILTGLSLQHSYLSAGLSQSKNSVAVCFSKIPDPIFLPKAGIADYWNARGVSYDLPKMNPILAMTKECSPFIWMSSIGMIKAPQEHPEFSYNFAILRKLDDKSPESTSFEFNTEVMGKLLPKPSVIYSCDETKTEIWFYKNRTLDMWVKNHLSQNLYLFQKGILNQVTIDGASFPGVVGNVEGKYRIASAIDNAGILNFGPYLDLDQGKYRIEMRYIAKDKTHSNVGMFEVGRFDLAAKAVTLQSKEFGDIDNGRVVLNIDIKSGGLQRMEFRTWYFGHGVLVLKSIKIIRLFKE